MKKVSGIWIDKRTAKIVSLGDSSEDFNTVSSSIEEFNPKGGSGTKLTGGPQDVVQDSRYTEREKHQQKRYFDSLVDYIDDSDEIVIFGPAEMGKKLETELSESYPKLHEKVKEVRSADSMTNNQIKAWVKEYFDRDDRNRINR